MKWFHSYSKNVFNELPTTLCFMVFVLFLRYCEEWSYVKQVPNICEFNYLTRVLIMLWCSELICQLEHQYPISECLGLNLTSAFNPIPIDGYPRKQSMMVLPTTAMRDLGGVTCSQLGPGPAPAMTGHLENELIERKSFSLLLYLSNK